MSARLMIAGSDRGRPEEAPLAFAAELARVSQAVLHGSSRPLLVVPRGVGDPPNA